MTEASRPTITDVARLAQVSKTTVSYVISGSGYVSEERRARIELAIARLGYHPNAFARGLRSRRLSTVGVISADAADPFAARVTSGILGEASARDIVVTLSASADVSATGRGPRAAGGQPADALIYIAGPDSSREAFAALSRQHHVVLVGEADPGAGVAAVRADPRPAARELASLVASCGHERVAIAVPDRERWSLVERVAGLREGLASAGIRLERVTTVAVDVSVDGGQEAVDRLFGDGRAGADRPTAVLCVDDSVAVGMLHGCRRIGLAVPEQVAVTGFGDAPGSGATTPALTTVSIPAEDLGRAAVEMLVERDGSRPDAISARTFPASLVVGGSVRTPLRSIVRGGAHEE